MLDLDSRVCTHEKPGLSAPLEDLEMPIVPAQVLVTIRTECVMLLTLDNPGAVSDPDAAQEIYEITNKQKTDISAPPPSAPTPDQYRERELPK